MSANSHKDLNLLKGPLARNRVLLLSHTLLVCLLISVPGLNLRGGTTGKITGHIQDASTGEGLVGANIVIDGTYMGAATDLDG